MGNELVDLGGAPGAPEGRDSFALTNKCYETSYQVCGCFVVSVAMVTIVPIMYPCMYVVTMATLVIY